MWSSGSTLPLVEHSRKGVAVRAVKSNWFEFDSILDSKVAESFWTNSIVIQYPFNSKTIQVNTKRISNHSKKRWKLRSWQLLKGVVHQKGRNKWELFEIMLFKLFKSFYCQITGVWLFTFLSISNQIKLYQKWKIDLILFQYNSFWSGKKNLVRSQNTICFWFDLTALVAVMVQRKTVNFENLQKCKFRSHNMIIIYASNCYAHF
jgi:hypothetical protein